MYDDRIILKANMDKTNIVDFDTFNDTAIKTLEDIANDILLLCGSNALQDLVVYRELAVDYLRNVFSNDGIHILKSTEFINPIQTYIANYIRYIAERVELAAGDGTSTAIYFASKLAIATLKQVKLIRLQSEFSNHHEMSAEIHIMKQTRRFVTDVTDLLIFLKSKIADFKININELNPELKYKLIYQLAYTTSKGNDELTKYIIEMFKDLPELLYEFTIYDKSRVETNERFIFKYPEHDLIIPTVASANTIYNSKLGTELLYDNCNLLIIPNLYGKVGIITEFISNYKEEYDHHQIPLIVVFTGGDDSENVQLEKLLDHRCMTLCKYIAYQPLFVNNPLELNVALLVSGKSIKDMKSVKDVNDALITNIKGRFHDNCLFLYGLFPKGENYVHPYYANQDDNFPEYHKLRMELEERVNTLKNSHNKTDNAQELKELIRIYRNLVCSRMPTLTIGGSALELLANDNLVRDVMGVVSVAMKHGVIIDGIPKIFNCLINQISAFDRPSEWLKYFVSSIKQFIILTYQEVDIITKEPDVIQYVAQYAANKDAQSIKMAKYDQLFKTWRLLDDDVSEHESIVVQSYKAFDELLNRLIETIPKLIATNRIIVPNSIMTDKKEE
jgi:hypothetical protein